MGNSFQDQLLKAGLVNKKQVKKAKHEKRINKKQKKGQSSSDETNRIRKEKQALEEHTKELNRQLNEKKKKHEKLAQARQLIETNRLKKDDRGEPYYFAVGKRIKKLFISEEMAKQLSRGQLAIAQLNDSFEIVTAKVARQIADRDQDALVVFHEPVQEQKK